jgi:D-alanine-D-alanine ligase
VTPSRILVLGGGRSSEHDVSLASSASVATGLRDAGFEVRSVVIGRDGLWRDEAGDELSLRPGRGIPEIDVVFPVLHGPFGEDGTVQGLLEMLDVPYVGAGVLASALSMDKIVFKELMAQAWIPQVEYGSVTLERWRENSEAVLRELEALGLPVFVKPARLGSSVGIARVPSSGPPTLRAALDDAFRYDPLVIVEAGASGIEVECSVLGNGDPIASLPGEILLAGGESGWYDYAAKYTPGGMKLVVPARISQTASVRVQALAVEAFLRSRCAGLARVDFFVDGESVLVNELNTLPGFTATSVYAALFAASGIEYPELLARLVALALERHSLERAHSF